MLFNSIEYLVFFTIVFIAHWYLFSTKVRFQNIFLLTVSYVFYGWWDYRFLSLIFFSSVVDFFLGLKIGETKKLSKRKLLLGLSLISNLGLLGFFKYYNFFIDSFSHLLSSIGFSINIWTLSVILPVGISFYTFQTLSYTIDIYRDKLKPTNNFISFLAFVSFFPQLVAGPIERASNLLPQFSSARKFSYTDAREGSRQILWGLFKKIVIADSCAPLVNEIFSNYSNYDGGILLTGAILFSFQIYGDFSGYSDIAIGTAKLFGINLMQNFAVPYFSRDIGEFWRRWHISLSTWFRDYLYIPMGGSRGSRGKVIRNIFIIFIISGLWHGANWTFVIWGLINAVFFVPLFLTGSNRKNLDVVAKGRFFPTFREVWQVCTTFFIVTIAWIFFRAETVEHGVYFITQAFTKLITYESVVNLFYFLKLKLGFEMISLFLLLFIIEWIQREKVSALFNLEKYLPSVYFRWTFYVFLCVIILNFFTGANQEFIYFQF